MGNPPILHTLAWSTEKAPPHAQQSVRCCSSIDSFHITWWLWKPVQLDGHLDWFHFDTYWSQNNCTCSCIVHWHDSFRSKGIKMESIKVAIQLHWFLWLPRYVKLVYCSACASLNSPLCKNKSWSSTGMTVSHDDVPFSCRRSNLRELMFPWDRRASDSFSLSLRIAHVHSSLGRQL